LGRSRNLDGRRFPQRATRGALLKWLKVEHDPDPRRDLKANLKLIMDEIWHRTGRRPAE
jgi:hypothetical protein